MLDVPEENWHYTEQVLMLSSARNDWEDGYGPQPYGPELAPPEDLWREMEPSERQHREMLEEVEREWLYGGGWNRPL